LLEIKHGHAFLGEHFDSTGTHIVLTPGSFYEEGGFKQKGDKEKWYNGPVPADYVLNEGDLIIAMTEQAEGLLGSSAIIPRSGLYLHNQRLGLVQIRDKKQTDPKFIYYLFNSKPVRQQIRASASGVKIRHTAPSRIGEVKTRVPLFPVQQRIAGILSAYDGLIENNLRRIRILEEMARNLYREWFVLYRFSGSEKLQRAESQFGTVPVGWVLPFADHVDFKEGPGLRNWQYRDFGIPFLNIRTLVDNDIDLTKVQFLDQKEVETKYQHFLLKEGDHVVSSSGTIGRIVTIRAEHLPLVLNTSIIRMRPNGKRMGRWLLKHFLLSDLFQNQAKSFAIGAAQANFGPIHLKQMLILAPSENICLEYERLVEPLELTIMMLAREINNLRKTRDLLLPRLLSGELRA
jgi:type I restriction enzyme S subunit